MPVDLHDLGGAADVVALWITNERQKHIERFPIQPLTRLLRVGKDDSHELLTCSLFILLDVAHECKVVPIPRHGMGIELTCSCVVSERPNSELRESPRVSGEKELKSSVSSIFAWKIPNLSAKAIDRLRDMCLQFDNIDDSISRFLMNIQARLDLEEDWVRHHGWPAVREDCIIPREGKQLRCMVKRNSPSQSAIAGDDQFLDTWGSTNPCSDERHELLRGVKSRSRQLVRQTPTFPM